MVRDNDGLLARLINEDNEWILYMDISGSIRRNNFVVWNVKCDG